MDDIYKNIEEYNPNDKSKILIVFDDIIADMLSNKKRNPTVTELFIRGRKLNISIVFTQLYFAVLLNGIKVRVIIKKKYLCCHDKNYYYFYKSNIPVNNLIAGSRDMIKKYWFVEN